MSNDGFDRLAAVVANCATAGVARQALLLRVDRMPISFTRPHCIRLAEAALAPMLRLPRAELFHLPGPNLAVVWRGDAERPLLDVIHSLEHLLTGPAGTQPLHDVIALYDLPDSGDLLIQATSQRVRLACAERVDAALLAMDPHLLALLEGCLIQADVARFARRHPVWRLGAGRPSLAWEDRSLCLAELTAQLAPGYDLRADPWLFRRLTRILDRRLLALLASPGELAQSGPFSIDLNIGSLLGPDFLRFDAALPASLRGRVILAISPADMVADARSLTFAAAFVKARGYRLLLRLGSGGALHAVAPTLPDYDYVCVPWSADVPSLVYEAPIDDGLSEQLVVTGADTQECLEWGMANGVALFCGSAAGRFLAA